MTLTAILAFALAMLLFSATPGPGIAATTARALGSGLAAAVGMMIGVRLTDLLFLTLALAGMTLITQALGELFVLIKLACGVYLVWLGYRLWCTPDAAGGIAPVRSRTSLPRNIGDGLLVGLSNPKSILFYAALLPSFTDLSAIGIADIAVLTVIVLITPTLVDLLYLAVASRLRLLVRGSAAGKLLRRIAAATLAGVGIAVAFDR